MRRLLLLALLAAPAHAADPWTGRLAAVGHTVARAPRFDAWLDGVARAAGAAEADPQGRALVEQVRAVARGPFAFDPFSGAAWKARGARVEAPSWFAQRGGRIVAAVVAAEPGAAARLAPEAPTARVGEVDVRRLPGLLVTERDGYVVTAADEPTLKRVLAAPATTPDESLCPPGEAALVVLGGPPGRTVGDGVGSCATIRLEAKRAGVEMRARGAAAAGLSLVLAREPAGKAPPLATADAVAVVRARLAPPGIGLLQAALLQRGLHRLVFARTIADRFTGDAHVVVDRDGETTAALRVRDAAAVRAALPASLVAETKPLSTRIHEDFVLLSTRAEPPVAQGAPPETPALLVDVRPSAAPAALFEALPDLQPWLPALRRIERLRLAVTTGDVLTVTVDVSGY